MRNEAALKALCGKHGDAVVPLVADLDPKDCGIDEPAHELRRSHLGSGMASIST